MTFKFKSAAGAEPAQKSSPETPAVEPDQPTASPAPPQASPMTPPVEPEDIGARVSKAERRLRKADRALQDLALRLADAEPGAEEAYDAAEAEANAARRSLAILQRASAAADRRAEQERIEAYQREHARIVERIKRQMPAREEAAARLDAAIVEACAAYKQLMAKTEAAFMSWPGGVGVPASVGSFSPMKMHQQVEQTLFNRGSVSTSLGNQVSFPGGVRHQSFGFAGGFYDTLLELVKAEHTNAIAKVDALPVVDPDDHSRDFSPAEDLAKRVLDPRSMAPTQVAVTRLDAQGHPLDWEDEEPEEVERDEDGEEIEDETLPTEEMEF